jgi:hypothetical protein
MDEKGKDHLLLITFYMLFGNTLYRNDTLQWIPIINTTSVERRKKSNVKVTAAYIQTSIA